jgi:hypothetical protein
MINPRGLFEILGGYSRAAVIGVREALSGRRRRLLAAAALASLVLILVWEHSGQGAHEMGDSMTPPLSTCLAVLESAGLALLAVAAMRRRRPVARPRMVVRLAAGAVIPPARPRLPPARAGPALLQSFRC